MRSPTARRTPNRVYPHSQARRSPATKRTEHAPRISVRHPKDPAARTAPPASLQLARLQAGSRRNPLAQALQEYGRLVKTNFVLAWLADEELRTRIGRQLNQGEQLHALRRAIFYANEGHIRQRTPDRQSEQPLCLAIAVNAIIAWNTVYIDRVLDELRASGEFITTSEIEHISPLAHQHIHLYGHYPFDLASRPDGHRALRTPATPPAAEPKALNRV
jgi:hypothetical protein